MRKKYQRDWIQLLFLRLTKICKCKTRQNQMFYDLVSKVFYCTTSLLLILLFTIGIIKIISQSNWFLMYVYDLKVEFWQKIFLRIQVFIHFNFSEDALRVICCCCIFMFHWVCSQVTLSRSDTKHWRVWRYYASVLRFLKNSEIVTTFLIRLRLSRWASQRSERIIRFIHRQMLYWRLSLR